MAPADITEMGLADLSARLAARELSSAEAVSAALTRLDRLEGKLNAFITVRNEQAHAEAKKADDEIVRGQYRGPLHGVPVTIKDMFETAGTRTTGGSKILQDWIPDTDAALVARLRAAGAIIIGKTNLDEFGHGGT
jgi:Asp-tRNA(Asn)/Glu-tRNA(Gln) amidotransferase A subunit family amidase